MPVWETDGGFLCAEAAMQNDLSNCRYLSFRTSDIASDSWGVQTTGRELLEQFGLALVALGFCIDLDAGKEEPDWLFGVHDPSNRFDVTRFNLVLSVLEFSPCRWFVFLEESASRQMRSRLILGTINPAIYKVVVARPGTSELQWHRDHTTLASAFGKSSN